MTAQLRIDFQGRRKVETFSWARVEAMRDGVQLALRIARQVGALGQILTQQPMGVFIDPALPGAVRIGKEDLDREPLGQLLVLGHLFPSIVRQGFPQQGGHMPEFFDEAPSGTHRIRPLHPGQDDQACRPLHQGANGRAIAGSFDEVVFPVAASHDYIALANEVISRLHTPTPTARVKPEVAKVVAETLTAEAPEAVASA